MNLICICSSLPQDNVYEEIECQVEEIAFRMNNLFDLHHMPDKFGSPADDDDSCTLDSSDEATYPSSYSTKDSISYTTDSLCSEDSGFFRHGNRLQTFQANYISEDEYEGPIIHHLDTPKQRTSDAGQFLSPIFGGRYFVKTSWSTFRAPKIQPGSIDFQPTSPIKPPKADKYLCVH